MSLSTEQQRLVSMLDYLEAWDKLNRTPVFDVAAHQGGFLAWQSDFNNLPGVHLNVADSSGEIWMEIERLRPSKPPEPLAALVPWIIVKDDVSSEPKHRESLPNPEAPEKPLLFEDNPMLLAAFKTFVAGPWRKWIESEKPRRESIAIYDKLFNLLQTIETEGAETALELVWGIGLAVWNKEATRVRYPLLSRLVEIDPISPDMALRVRPRETPPILETDIYVALENPGLPAFEKASRAILEHPDSDVTPFNDASYEQILSGAAGTLDRHARYWPREPDFEPGKLPLATTALTVTNTWVVFARQKGTNFLIEDIRRLRSGVEANSIPDGAPKVLVEDPQGPVPERQRRSWRGLSSSGQPVDNRSWGDTSDQIKGVSEARTPSGELYFPKPFNSEQVQIIERLEHASGVVVQGPPGTGKTHTIANVICHYLAEGKRVLVTCKGESALAVLRNQLPTPVQALTVSLLTSEREGLRQLEQSISKITSEITSLDKAEVRREIERSRRSIDDLHERIGEIDRELGDWAKRNINPAPVALDGLRPAALAQHVLDLEKVYSWFPDRLDGRSEHEIKICNTEVSRLREARRMVGKDIIYVCSTLPEPQILPSRAQIGDLHRSLLDLDSINDVIDEQRVPRFRSIENEHLSAASRVREILVAAAETRRQFSDKWLDWLRRQCEARHEAQPVFRVVLEIVEEFSNLTEARKELFGIAIEWEDDWDSDDDLYDAVQNSAQGKSAFGLNPFGKKAARERHQKVRLNGKPPRQPDDWRWVASHLVLRRRTRTAVCRWNSLEAECPCPHLPKNPSEALRSIENLLEQVRQVHRWVNEVGPSLPTEIQTIFAEVETDGIANDIVKMELLAEAVQVRLKRHRLETAREEVKRLRDLFKNESLPLFAEASAFLCNCLGKPRYDTSTVESSWQAIADECERLCVLQGAFATIRAAADAIHSAGAVEWAKRLKSEPVGNFDWTPLDWADAWKWSRQFGYLLNIDGRERIQSISAKRLDFQSDLSAAYVRLVEQLTWLKLRESLDQDRGLMSALQQYMAAIRGIGAGTGVRAVRYRKDAQHAMKKANGAIRCWIMPHWRVSESLPSELALFDLVIIDEASQSDLWALPAMLRAKKLLIVGDNKQVSPSAVGVREVDIRQLHSRFLRTLPFADVLSPEKSIYDLASVMFASDLIRLREHFRCVEPIIEFSNRLCYNGEIKCLRVAKASERITPPLVDVFVRNGARDARSVKINRAEARAIIEEIRILTNNPAFANRTIGVVSLLGSDQPRHIFEGLIAELGEEKIVKHQIRCGDAMTFQGREADIVFISMVSDAETVRALSGETYEQRFNVAVSRAKDRLYLYRSFRREDLKENDLRARLLDHFASPLHADPEKKGRERCESDFERAVFDRLHTAGYRVTPQVSAGGYRIDLVVEGHSGRRLAVECDGDQYHSPDMWLEDLHRQRTLERAGWTFWRCWGSSFIREPETCMADLFRTLKALGIEPIGAEDIDLTTIVEYREVGPGNNSADEEGAEFKLRRESVAPKSPETDRETRNNSENRRHFVEDFSRSNLPVQSLTASTVNGLPPRKAIDSQLRVAVGDSVRYCFVDAPEDDAFVTIVDSASNPNLGIINKDTVIARALAGLSMGEEGNAALPLGKRKIRVLDINKPRRRH